MNAVIDPGRLVVDERHSPSTVRSRGAARVSIRTISRRHHAGRVAISSGLAAPQKKQADLIGTGRPASRMRAAQRARSHRQLRKGY